MLGIFFPNIFSWEHSTIKKSLGAAALNNRLLPLFLDVLSLDNICWLSTFKKGYLAFLHYSSHSLPVFDF